MKHIYSFKIMNSVCQLSTFGWSICASLYPTQVFWDIQLRDSCEKPHRYTTYFDLAAVGGWIAKYGDSIPGNKVHHHSNMIIQLLCTKGAERTNTTVTHFNNAKPSHTESDAETLSLYQTILGRNLLFYFLWFKSHKLSFFF